MSEGEGGGEREIVRKKDRETKREGEKERQKRRGERGLGRERGEERKTILTFHSFFQSRHHFTSTQSKTQRRIFLKIIENLLPSIHTQIT